MDRWLSFSSIHVVFTASETCHPGLIHIPLLDFIPYRKMTSSVVEQIESFDAEKTFEAFKRSITCTENGSDARTRLEELREQVLEVKSAVQTSKCRTLKQGLERELWTPTAMITNRLLELDEALEEKQRCASCPVYLLRSH